MKQTIYLSDFRSAFHDMSRGSQFSYEALGLIFEHLEELEQDTGEEINFDVIAICCDYCEEDPLQIASSYDIELSDPENEKLLSGEVMEYLTDRTFVVGETSTGSIVYQNF